MPIQMNLRVGRLLLLCAALFTFSLGAQQPSSTPAQTPSQQTTQPVAQEPIAKTEQPIKVNVKVVNLQVTVREKSGKFINTLAQNDFSIEEEGHPQVIKYFS